MNNIINWYNNLSPDTLQDIGFYYTNNCYFKDPFNEKFSRNELHTIFSEMYKKLNSPRFVITNHFSQGDEHVLFWDFTFIFFSKEIKIKGNSHLKLNAENLIYYHCDYWDSISELWIKTPILGFFIKTMYKII